MKRKGVFLGVFAVVAILAGYFWNAKRIEETLYPTKGYTEIESVSASEPSKRPVSPGEARREEVGTRVAPATLESPNYDPADPLSPKLLSRYGAEDRTIADDLRLVDDALQRFWLIFKNPDLLQVGSNESILRVLTGANPEGIEFVSPRNRFLDDSGRLLDRWGEPLFFHALSMTHIEARSAGPDRMLYTEDDVFIGAKAASQRLPTAR